jgi:ABC-type Fe3+-siderophore transport system permease subunit
MGPGERAAVGGLVLGALAIIAATALLAPKAFRVIVVVALFAGPIAIIIQSVRVRRRMG